MLTLCQAIDGCVLSVPSVKDLCKQKDNDNLYSSAFTPLVHVLKIMLVALAEMRDRVMILKRGGIDLS